MILTKQYISNIDSYLKKKGKNYTGVCLELIDHLVLEHESMKNYLGWERFLQKQTVWYRNVVVKKLKLARRDYQKDLRKGLKLSCFIGIIIIQFFRFFTSQYRSKQKLKRISPQYLLNIFSLHHIFLSFLGLVVIWLKAYEYQFLKPYFV